MECNEIREKFYAFLDGELDADQAETLQRHLRQCQTCSNEAAAIRGFYTATRSLPSVCLPAAQKETRFFVADIFSSFTRSL